jgi:hypothetical protein
MYYLTGKMTQQLQQLRTSNSTNVNMTNVKSIAKNFEVMQYLSQFYLN